MTFIVNKDNGSRLFYFRVFDSKENVPNYVSSGHYLYAYELSGNVIFGSTEGKYLKSMTSHADGRVAVLGPIRDTERVMEETEHFIREWKSGKHPRIYRFETLEEFIGNPDAPEDELPGLFQLAQMTFKDGFKGKDHVLHSFDKENVVRDLIIPEKHGRITLVIFETKDGIRTGEEMTAVV